MAAVRDRSINQFNNADLGVVVNKLGVAVIDSGDKRNSEIMYNT